MKDPRYYGVYQGKVTSLKDPEHRGRIKVICPVVLGSDEESAWCDPMVPVAYDYGGDFYLPEVGEFVWIMFIEGNSNYPVWCGGWWQQDMSPLASNYTKLGKVRIINYSDCTITMSNGIIDISVGEGNYDLRIQDGKITINGDLHVKGRVITD